MRLRAGVLILGASALATACSGEGDPQSSDGEAAAKPAETIACALEGDTDFASECRVERAAQGSTRYLVVRHPDGAFRRFQVLTDGRGLAAADGAQTAETEVSGDLLEVSVGKDRYRFPARRISHAPTS